MAPRGAKRSHKNVSFLDIAQPPTSALAASKL